MTNAKNPDRLQLPDDIVRQILRLLPIKAAVCIRLLSKQFDDLWSIDLDEGDPLDMDHDNSHQHTEFINFVETSLRERKNDKHVDKFRLRMMRYSPKDSAFISTYLGFAFERNVMVLDVSLRSKPGLPYHTLSSAFLERNYITTLNLEYLRINLGNRRINLPLLRTLSFKSVVLDSQDSLSKLVSSCPKIENLSLNLEENTAEVDDTTGHKDFSLSLETLLGLKCIITLHVENMNIRGDPNSHVVNPTVLPLKTMSLNNVNLKSNTFSSLLENCPSIEYLSLSSCFFPSGSDVQFKSSSLKTFEVTDLNAGQLNVDGAMNLESFTLVSELGSEIRQPTRAALHGCKNLKHVNICSEQLQAVVLGGCKDCVEATIYTPNLMYFHFNGNLKSTLCMEAPNLCDTTITVLWRDFSTLVDFLKTFGHSKRIILVVDDAEVDIVFPERLRESVSCPPLPSLKNFVVRRKDKLKGRDSDLRNSMLWMAPFAEIVILSR